MPTLNGEENGNSKLTDEAVDRMRFYWDQLQLARTMVNVKAWAQQYGVREETIRKALQRRTWKTTPTSDGYFTDIGDLKKC